MGLFGTREKKTCGICGKELGLLGKTKLEDGYLCKDCAQKLSPFFKNTRHSTVVQIQKQLEYRAANERAVAAFNPTRELGGTWRVLFDDNARKLMVTNQRDWRTSNPDVLDYSDVTGADVRIDEDRRELYTKDANGHQVSYRPPRYETDYDFWLTIRVRNPYFGTIEFKLNQWSVTERFSAEYDRAERQANELRGALLGIMGQPTQTAQYAGAQYTGAQYGAGQQYGSAQQYGTGQQYGTAQQATYGQAPQQAYAQQAPVANGYGQPLGYGSTGAQQQATAYGVAVDGTAQVPMGQQPYAASSQPYATSPQQAYQQQAQQSAAQAAAQPGSAQGFCPNCGAPIASGTHFCESCGSLLGA